MSVELGWCIEDTGECLDWARPGGLQLRSRRSVWLHDEDLIPLFEALHEVATISVQQSYVRKESTLSASPPPHVIQLVTVSETV